MAERKGKANEKAKSRAKKLSVKKQPIKDLDPKVKDVKGGRQRPWDPAEHPISPIGPL